MLLDAIPQRIQILELHTDIQGYDLIAIMSAGNSIRRIPKLQTEVNINENAYVGVNNSFEEDWKPYMSSIGYKFSHQTSFKSEADVFWNIDE